MSQSSDTASDPGFSPATSPIKHSPATSPIGVSTDSDSSNSAEQLKRRKRQYAMGSMASRSTIRRRLMETDEDICYDGDGAGPSSTSTRLRNGSPPAQHALDENEVDSEVHSQPEDEEILSSIDSVGTGSSDSENSVRSEQACSVKDSSAESANDSDCLSDDDCDNLFDGSDIKTNEAMLDILKLYIEERWTKGSLHKTLCLMKKILPQPNSLPGSLKQLLRVLKDLTSIRGECEYFYCSHCQEPKGSKSDECSKCKQDKGTSTFFLFSVEDQIKHMLEQRNLAAAIEFYSQQSSDDENICDIRDGSEYKKIKANLKGKFDMVLVWNTDGVSLSGSSKQELWPVMSFICEVPPKLRSSYIIFSGIYVGPKKPRMNVYLKPFVDTMKSIYEKGGINWIHPVTRQNVKSMIVAPILCADAPAKAIVMNTMNYNSKYGCLVCEQKAGSVKTTYRRADSPTVRERTRRVFLYQETAACIRTGERMARQAASAQRMNVPVRGVIREAVISNIPFLDLGVCCCAEYMHNCLLGVVKYVLNLMLTVKGPWYIGDKIHQIDSFISKFVRIPDTVKRLPRSLLDLHKASEYRNFVLYYSVPALKDHLPDKYFQHWLLLVISLHILLSESISKVDLRAANIMLKCFVRDFGTLYDEKYNTYNLHNLLHAVLLVERWGPLWATSAFIFEDYNGFIKNHIFGSKHFARELLNNLQIIQCVTLLENMVRGRQFSFTNIIFKESDVTFSNPLKCENLSVDEKKLILGSGNCTIFKRVVLSSGIYTSKYYDSNKKRMNSIVQFTDSDGVVKLGEIICFLKSLKNGQPSALCLIRIFSVEHVRILYHTESRFPLKNFVPVQVDKNAKLVINSVSCLVQKLLKVGGYVCIPPNLFEINL